MSRDHSTFQEMVGTRKAQWLRLPAHCRQQVTSNIYQQQSPGISCVPVHNPILPQRSQTVRCSALIATLLSGGGVLHSKRNAVAWEESLRTKWRMEERVNAIVDEGDMAGSRRHMTHCCCL